MNGRYDFQRLVDLMETTQRQAQKQLTMSGQTFKNAVENGLGFWAADRYAVRAGFHPAFVWPEWLEDSIEHDLVRYRERKNREARERYARRADVREAKQAARRRAYAEAAEYERARERARYWADPESARARKRVAR